jgi:HD-like signal output (HDOD) protein
MVALAAPSPRPAAGPAAVFEIPMLPEVATRVMSLARRDDADPKDLAQLIRNDPALAAQILRMANSALYGSPGRIVSLQQALTRLGLQTIARIAVVVAARARLFSVEGHEAEVRACFRRSVATALYAQEVARLRRANVEEAFLAGLFHDLGRPILLQRLSDAGLADEPLVRSVVEALRAEVAALVLTAWAFAPRIVEAVRHHQDPAGLAAPEPAQTVALARALAAWALGPASDPARLATHPCLAPLGLYPDDLDSLLRRRDPIAAAAGELA